MTRVAGGWLYRGYFIHNSEDNFWDWEIYPGSESGVSPNKEELIVGQVPSLTDARLEIDIWFKEVK